MNKISKLRRQDQYLIHEGQNAPRSEHQGGDSQSAVLDAPPAHPVETQDSQTPPQATESETQGWDRSNIVCFSKPSLKVILLHNEL